LNNAAYLTTKTIAVFIVPSRSNPRQIHWDHVVPFVFSGGNDGFVAACPWCNLHKSDKIFDTLEEARTYLALKRHGIQEYKASQIRKMQAMRGTDFSSV
jgi:hypothetical protein